MFNKHIAMKTEKARIRMKVMRAITGPHRGSSLAVLKIYYIHSVRSVIEYGAPCLSTAIQAALSLLEKIQNQAMRLMVGASAWTRICPLQAKTNIPPLHTRLCAITIYHLAKYLRRNGTPAHISRIQQALLQGQTLFTKNTWAHKAADTMKKQDTHQFFLQLMLGT